MNSLPPTTSAVSSPVSSLDSPLSVISSSVGSPGAPVTPSVGYGPVSNPQINSSMSGLHAVSSSDDVKPSFCLKSAGGTGPMLSQKRLCAICGDRSSAVQDERQRNKERDGDYEFSSSANEEMPVEKILEAETAVEHKTELRSEGTGSPGDPVTNICQAADKQLYSLVEWAKRIPHFSELPLDDQVILLRAGWNELLIASFSHRSIGVEDSLLLATGLHVSRESVCDTGGVEPIFDRESSHSAEVGAIFDRVLTELVNKMRDMQMDKTELGCLRAIVLFNPDAKGLSKSSEVELLRERVYASLEAYCRQKYPEQQGRFAKLLLRLPALRSIGLKCLEHLFFFKLIGDTPLDTFLMEMLEARH
ncbi:retinoic acid receptor RXR-beta-B isoform X2 [Electrophorus electricus]|uniref:retinoic acid receptor RXR-beta-B isoform X2 n=1 Tax=Electrophorus electricus TaxID=8005 RepID=UPI000F0A3841|nr:retinoic acid receptor RXR-beta-B isoform X2 [Electrophorus electricus]